MNTVLLTALAAAGLLVALFVIWGGIQLLANRRLGFRRMGCRGPITNSLGEQVCCQTGEACEHADSDRAKVET